LTIHVVWDEEACRLTREEGRSCYTEYMFELLTYLGLSHTRMSPANWMAQQPQGLTIVVGGCDDPAWPAACEAYCRRGHALLAVGGLHGLERLLRVKTDSDIIEGWVSWADAPLAKDLHSSFHFFGSVILRVAAEADAVGVGAGPALESMADPEAQPLEQWGQLIRRSGAASEPFPAVAIKPVGRGRAAVLTVNLMETFCLIQQGVKVVKDGTPAPDGTAAIDDNILKADDMSVLDWTRDRNAAAPEGVPFYLHPIVDEWRILFMRLLHRLALETGQSFGQVWLWPGGLSAIGHISHDTDGNIVERGLATLDRLAEARVNSTWCIIAPGYPAEVNDRIAREGHEVALHYNALGTEIPESQWKETHFRYQLGRLQAQFPNVSIVSNKNHYLRWEGDFQLLQWCERQGIAMEQSKGGTKQGNKGFTFGTSHPHLSFDPATGGYAARVVSLPTLSWDPPFPLRCTAEEAFALTERVRDTNGVAHFLFHPSFAGNAEDQVGEMMVKLVAYGRSLGLEWWTSEQIWKWFELRRQVTVEWSSGAVDTAHGRIVSTAGEEIEGVTVLLAWDEAGFGTPGHSWRFAADNGAELTRIVDVTRFGCAFKEVQLRLQPGETKIWLT